MENPASIILETPKEKQNLKSINEYKIKYNNIIEIGNSSLPNSLGFRLKELSFQLKNYYENFLVLKNCKT